MPPDPAFHGGCNAFVVTVRPREEHFSDELVDSVRTYVETKIGADWHLIVKEKGNHLHCAVFLHEPQQRSNFATKWLNNPLRDYDEQERRNFRKWDNARNTSAIKGMTSLHMVTEYLSGQYEGKEDDDFEVVSENLPSSDDISELEEYLPAVNGLKKDKDNIRSWCGKMEPLFREKHPDVEVMTEALALMFIQTKMFVDRDMDIIYDQRILRQKVRSFVPFFNKNAPGYYLDYRGGSLPARTPYPLGLNPLDEVYEK